jgi:hypothetical protein
MSLEFRNDATAPHRVARSEAELLELAHKLFNPDQRYIPSLRQRPRNKLRIDAIGPTAMGLLQQTLANGVASELLRRGGWQTRRTLVDGRPKRGRLWERHPKLPVLRFGPVSFELLVWLRAEDVAEPKQALERSASTSLADELLLYFAAEQIVKAGGSLQQDAFLCSPLVQLGFPDALAGPKPLPTVDFRPFVRGDGAIVLEALQPELAARIVTVETRKHLMVALDKMVQLGAAQAQVFDALVRAVDALEPRRRDLASFVAEAARDLLARGPERRCPDHRWWVAALDQRARMADRQAAFAAAAAFLRMVGVLGQWLDEAGLVAHFDDDYEAAQLLLSSWQFLRTAPEPATRSMIHEQPQLPASILDRANTLARSLESLHSLGATDVS